MPVSTKLITALSGIAVCAAGMVAANLWGAIVPLQGGLALAMALCLIWGFALALSLANGLRRIGAVCRETNLGNPASVVAMDPGDELAVIEAALTRQTAHCQELVSAATQGLGALVEQTAGLSSLVQQGMAQLATDSAIQHVTGASIKTLADDAASIASRIEGVNERMSKVTDTSLESSAQVGIIVGATEKMSATIESIAINAEKARSVAGAAVSNVNATSRRVDELGAAALEINKVTDVIVEIAEQTKLLALNATIEAARAGEAGKGFAVVANEVKELALQTNNAIAEIRNKVEAMQHSTDNTIAEIGAINQTIKAVNEIVVTIAGAVEEQSIPTRDIVRQLNQGVSGINTIRETVEATAMEVREIADRINRIATTSHELAGGTDPASRRKEGLSPLLSSIKQLTGDLQSKSEGLLATINSLS